MDDDDDDDMMGQTLKYSKLDSSEYDKSHDRYRNVDPKNTRTSSATWGAACLCSSHRWWFETMGKLWENHWIYWIMAFYYHWHHCSFKFQSCSYVYHFFWPFGSAKLNSSERVAVATFVPWLTAWGDGWKGSNWKTWRHGMQASSLL